MSQRYWDGYEWTNQMAPLSPTADATPSGGVDSGSKTYATLLHLSAFVVALLGPLVMWLIKKNDSSFVDDHGKAALNFKSPCCWAVWRSWF